MVYAWDTAFEDNDINISYTLNWIPCISVLPMACQLQLCIPSGSSDKTVRLWDVQSGERVRIFIGHRSMILSLAMSPDGRRHMASADEDGTIKTWDLSSGRCISPLIGHNSCVWPLMARFNKT